MFINKTKKTTNMRTKYLSGKKWSKKAKSGKKGRNEGKKMNV